MSTALKHKLDKIMKQRTLDNTPIIAGQMKPKHWIKIKRNKEIQVILRIQKQRKLTGLKD